MEIDCSSTIPIAIMVIFGNLCRLAGLAMYSDRSNSNVGERTCVIKDVNGD